MSVSITLVRIMSASHAPGARWQPAPAGAARGLPGSTAPDARLRWADPVSMARPGGWLRHASHLAGSSTIFCNSAAMSVSLTIVVAVDVDLQRNRDAGVAKKAVLSK